MTPEQSPISLGPFDLEKPIGSGGMAEVWRAVHRSQGVAVAVKVLRLDAEQRGFAAATLRREIRSVARLEHPGIVRLLDTGDVSPEAEKASEGMIVAGNPYLVMELAHEGSLSQLGEQLSWAEMLEILLQILDALAHAHARGLVHRDIKPANILVHSEQDIRPGAKLTDFGIAQHLHPNLDSTFQSRNLDLAGTPPYAAPEVFTGEQHMIGPWTDLYSLGCVAFKMITGSRPFHSNNPVELAHAHLFAPVPEIKPRIPVPPALDGWIRRMLAKLPQDRFARAADAARMLRHLERVDQESASSIEVRPKEVDDEGLENTEILAPPDSEISLTVPSGGNVLDCGSTTWTEAMYQPSRWSPPVPESWRVGPSHQRHSALTGVGLSLFGLRPIPLVGREPERDQLWAGLQRCAQERQLGLTVVLGPKGAGKSHLIRWFTQHADELGCARVISVSHTPYGGPNDGLGPSLSRELRYSRLPEEEGEAIVRAFTGRLGLEHYSRLLSDSLKTTLVRDTSESTTTAFFPSINSSQRDEMFASIFEAMAGQRPLILWVDDAQWGRSTLRMIEKLTRPESSHSGPVFCVVSAREDLLDERPLERSLLESLMERSETVSMGLAELDSKSSRKLVQSMLPLSGEVTDQVVSRTDGMPAHAVQLVADWVERGLLEPRDSGFSFADGADIALPDSIHTTFQERLLRLSEALPQGSDICLELLAALGGAADIEEWQATCKEAGTALSPVFLERLEGAAVATFDSGVWRLRWTLMLESLERRATKEGRWRSHHLACVSMLRSSSDSSAVGMSARRSRHLLAAASWEPAIEELLQAAQDTRITGEFEQGLDFLERCVEAMEAAGYPDEGVERCRFLVLKANLVRLAQRGVDASQVFAEQAAEMAERIGAEGVLADAMRCISIAHRSHSRLDQALEAIEQAQRLASSLDNTPLLADVMRIRAEILYEDSQYEEAAEWSARGVVLYEMLRQDLGILIARRGGAKIQGALGDPHAALEILAGAERIAHDPSMMASMRVDYHTARAETLLLLGDSDGASESLDVALATSRECPLAAQTITLLTVLSNFERSRGDLDRALSYLQLAESRSPPSGASRNALWIRVNTCILLVQRQSYREAAEMLDRLELTKQQLGQRLLALANQLIRLPDLCLSGSWDEAEAALAKTSQLLHTGNFTDFDLGMMLDRIGALCAEGDRPLLARQAYELALPQWEQLTGRDEEAERCRGALARL